MAEENNPSSTVPEEQDVSSPEGEENVSTPETAEKLPEPSEAQPEQAEASQESAEEAILKFAEEATGKKYTSVEKAAKSIKDTQSHVGRQKKEAFKEPVEPEPEIDRDAKVSLLEEEVEALKFLKKAPECEPYMDLIKDLALARDESFDEVAKSEEVQTLIKSRKDTKSPILETNRRVGVTKSKYQDLLNKAAKDPKYLSDQEKEDLVKAFEQ